MIAQHFTFKDAEGIDIYVYHWLPEPPSSRAGSQTAKGVVQIAHGMAETAARYEHFAKELTKAGYIIYANDHRGHGLTAGTKEQLGYLGIDGFNWLVRDMAQLNEQIRADYPGLPVILFGHSMGSFLTQKFMYTYPHLLDAVILSGSNGPRSMLKLGRMVAFCQMKLQGDQHPSVLLNALSFGSFNKGFKPSRTLFDWISCDEAEVDKFVANPYCGFICSTRFFYDFFGMLQEIHRPEQMQLVPKDLPVYIFSGDKDPVGLDGEGVKKLISLYEQLGIKKLKWKLYPDGRHEMLNERNRDEVMDDIIHWLDTDVHA